MTTTSTVERLWRRVLPGHNPLARGTDRAEGTVLLALFLLALLAVPIASAVGSEVYVGRHTEALRQLAEREQVTAVLLTDAATPSSAGASDDATTVDGYAVSTARAGMRVERPAVAGARWSTADGVMGEGVLAVARGSGAGAEVTIWVDQQARPTTPPLTTQGALADAIASAAGLWLVVLMALSGCGWLARRALDRVRYAGWERAWRDLDEQAGAS